MTELSPTGGSEGYGACDGVTTLRSYDSRASGDRECPHRQGCVANVASKFFKVRYHGAVYLNRSPSSRQLKKYKFFLPAEIYLLAVFMRLVSKFRVFPLVLKFRDSFVSVYCYSNLYNLRSFLREYLYQ